MQLNGDFLKSFWGLTPEQENKMMQNSREKRIREESLAVGEKNSIIQIAKKMLKQNYSLKQISDLTNLSASEIETLM